MAVMLRAIALTVVLLACTPSDIVRPIPAAATPPDPWVQLASRAIVRPPATSQCAVATESDYTPSVGGQTWTVLGDGPAYPAQRAQLRHPAGSGYLGIDGRSYRKTVWLVDATYQGPVLVRGTRLEDGAPLHFDDGAATPPVELRIAPNVSVTGVAVPGGHRDRPSSFSVPGPGCYAYQIDGVGFTKHIVFHIRD